MRGALSIVSLLLAGCTFGVSPVDPPEAPVGSGPTMPGTLTSPVPPPAGSSDNNHLGIGGGAVVTGSGATGLNLRSAPSTTATVLDILPEGSWVHLDAA